MVTIVSDSYQYVGEMLNGQMNGNGTLVFNEGSYYIGKFENGRFSGQGVYTYLNMQMNGTFINGDFYSGELYFNQATYKISNGLYKDIVLSNKLPCFKINFQDEQLQIQKKNKQIIIIDQQHQQLYQHYYNGQLYDGQFLHQKDCQHSVLVSSQFIYVGSFSNLQMHGFGTLVFNNGSIYRGNFHYNRFSGSGLFKSISTKMTGNFTDGDFYSGELAGKYIQQVYKGNWKQFFGKDISYAKLQDYYTQIQDINQLITFIDDNQQINVQFLNGTIKSKQNIKTDELEIVQTLITDLELQRNNATKTCEEYEQKLEEMLENEKWYNETIEKLIEEHEKIQETNKQLTENENNNKLVVEQDKQQQLQAYKDLEEKNIRLMKDKDLKLQNMQQLINNIEQEKIYLSQQNQQYIQYITQIQNSLAACQHQNQQQYNQLQTNYTEQTEQQKRQFQQLASENENQQRNLTQKLQQSQNETIQLTAQFSKEKQQLIDLFKLQTKTLEEQIVQLKQNQDQKPKTEEKQKGQTDKNQKIKELPDSKILTKDNNEMQTNNKQSNLQQLDENFVSIVIDMKLKSNDQVLKFIKLLQKQIPKSLTAEINIKYDVVIFVHKKDEEETLKTIRKLKIDGKHLQCETYKRQHEGKNIKQKENTQNQQPKGKQNIQETNSDNLQTILIEESGEESKKQKMNTKHNITKQIHQNIIDKNVEQLDGSKQLVKSNKVNKTQIGQAQNFNQTLNSESSGIQISCSESSQSIEISESETNKSGQNTNETKK
ncbi:peptidase_C13 [Hexamita inflata]|uniref:Peptidase C13 n=1 Tax=Hexamita inflata TaxID=28002 RepID=A0AA86RC85_9EUKA|nr:peptidase C13 [Hexamita inflata]